VSARESANAERVRELYELAKRGDHRALRALLHDDVRWEPAREGAWKPCENADDVIRTIMWRAGITRLRPAETIDLGDRVLVELRGRGVERLGAKGLFPRLFQIIVLRDGKITSMRDYPRRSDALEAAGLRRS